MAGRRYGSGCRTSSRTSVTAITRFPSLDDERTVHLAWMHIALEVVRALLQRSDLVRLGGRAGEEIRRAGGPSETGPSLGRVLRVDLEVVRDTLVLVVEGHGERLADLRRQAVRVERDVLRCDLETGPRGGALRPLGLLGLLLGEP